MSPFEIGNPVWQLAVLIVGNSPQAQANRPGKQRAGQQRAA